MGGKKCAEVVDDREDPGRQKLGLQWATHELHQSQRRSMVQNLK